MTATATMAKTTSLAAVAIAVVAGAADAVVSHRLTEMIPIVIMKIASRIKTMIAAAAVAAEMIETTKIKIALAAIEVGDAAGGVVAMTIVTGMILQFAIAHRFRLGMKRLNR
jgi:hypothetical protein